MALIRYAMPWIDPDANVPIGLVAVAYDLSRDLEVPEGDRDRLAVILRPMERDVPVPARFNRSTSKGAQRRAPVAICWWRDTALDWLARMDELEAIARTHGWDTRIVRTDRVGYVVYEDAWQVVAVPFRDTPTGL